MLAIWRCTPSTRPARGLGAGIVLTGGSAGMICWFEAGVTDSFGPQLAACRRARLPAGQRLPALRRRGAAPPVLPAADRRRISARLGRRRERRPPLPRNGARRGALAARGAAYRVDPEAKRRCRRGGDLDRHPTDVSGLAWAARTGAWLHGYGSSSGSPQSWSSACWRSPCSAAATPSDAAPRRRTCARRRQSAPDGQGA